MLRVAICDDDHKQAQMLALLLRDYVGEAIEASCYSNSQSLLDALAKADFGFDAVFLDIMLGEESGIETGLSLYKKYPNLCIVYITGYIEYSQDIFNSNPCGFLLKPITTERLQNALKLIRDRLDSLSAATISVKFGSRVEKLEVRDISYITSGGRKADIFIKGEIHSTYAKLDELERSLPNAFLRCHKSYLVNIHHIASFDQKDITLHSGDIIPVASKRRAEVKRKIFDL